MAEDTRRAFSLPALAIGIAVVGLAAGIAIPTIATSSAESRDARRVRDTRAIVAAIERFHRDHGRYPSPDGGDAHSGWDVSHDGGFLGELVDGGYLAQPRRDPLDDDEFHYRYCVYSSGAYGCADLGPFYVLGVRRFESPETAAMHRSTFECVGRDWSSEFAYVVGGRASSR